MTVTGTPADEKGKEVEGSYGKPDHVLVGNGNRVVYMPMSAAGARKISHFRIGKNDFKNRCDA